MKQMKNILFVILVAFGLSASAQQVNPVPDYTFANRMSAGRNTVTDTAAYFSIGPRYGAIRGMMPPMVVDTALVSGNKRNGLLIFSVQKNKFVYWDSVGSKWAEMAGTGGTAINSGDTAAMLLPYLRKADTTAMLAPYLKESDTTFLSNRINLKVNISDTSSMLTNYVRHSGYGLTKSGQAFLVDTAAMATRARVQKGIDSVAGLSRIGGVGNTGYIPKFSSTTSIVNSMIYDNSSAIGINTTTPSVFAKLDVNGQIRSSDLTTAGFYQARKSDNASEGSYNGNSFSIRNGNASEDLSFDVFNRTSSVWTTPMIIKNEAEVYINNTTDFGDFRLQIGGNVYFSGTSRTGTITLNTNGQNRTIGNYFGANSDGNNFWIGGGGLSSIGQVGNTVLGSRNSAYGISSGLSVTTGYSNTYLGYFSGYSSTTGYRNVAIGDNTLYTNVSGFENVAVGGLALFHNTQSRNVAIGYSAGLLTTTAAVNNESDSSIYIGYNVKSGGQTSNNEIVIGFEASGNGSNTVTIGNSSTTSNYFTGSIRTSAPTGGSIKPWRLGEVATVSPTSPNRTIRVEIDGTVYYLHAKTTND
jgi:hypothetical protein